MVKVDIAGSAVFGIAFLMFGMFTTNFINPIDIASPYLGGWFFEHGNYSAIYEFSSKDMFNATLPQSWHDAAVQAGIHTKTLYPYVYPPIWAALLGPLTQIVTFSVFSKSVFLIHFILIYCSIFLSWRLAGRPGFFLLWALISSIYIFGSTPGMAALAQNQPHILIVFLMLLGLERLESGHGVSAGVAIALAATIKITPVLLIILFVVKKEWRGFWAMVTTGALTGALIVAASFLIAGVDLHMAYLAYVAEMGNTVFISVFNWSFSTSLYQLSAEIMGYPLDPAITSNTPDLPKWISLLSLGALVLGVIYWSIRLHSARPRYRPILYSILFIWIGFFGPMGWAYYYLPVLFLWPSVILNFPNLMWRLFSLTVFVGLLNPSLVKYFKSFDSPFALGQLYGSSVILGLLLLLMFLQRRGLKEALTPCN